MRVMLEKYMDIFLILGGLLQNRYFNMVISFPVGFESCSLDIQKETFEYMKRKNERAKLY